MKVDESKFEAIDINKATAGTQDEQMTLALEQRLNALGYIEQADSVFDEQTKEAVSRFQAVLGHEITGIPGLYEYIYLNDYNYTELTTIVDNQIDAAIEYFK